MYLHPYEIDPPPFQEFYMEEVRKSSLRAKWKLYAYWYNRKTVMPKLGKLLRRYRFDTLNNVIQATLKAEH